MQDVKKLDTVYVEIIRPAWVPITPGLNSGPSAHGMAQPGDVIEIETRLVSHRTMKPSDEIACARAREIAQAATEQRPPNFSAIMALVDETKTRQCREQRLKAEAAIAEAKARYDAEVAKAEAASRLRSPQGQAEHQARLTAQAVTEGLAQLFAQFVPLLAARPPAEPASGATPPASEQAQDQDQNQAQEQAQEQAEETSRKASRGAKAA